MQAGTLRKLIIWLSCHELDIVDLIKFFVGTGSCTPHADTFDGSTLQRLRAPLDTTWARMGRLFFANLRELDIRDSPAVELANDSFREMANLATFFAPKGLVVVGEFAFYCCTDLVNVWLPDSVEAINASAFRGCDSLRTFRGPAALRSVGEEAFSSCRGLESLSFPAGVTELPLSALRRSSRLMDVSFECADVSAARNCFPRYARIWLGIADDPVRREHFPEAAAAGAPDGGV